jgi:signal transduction histidine kinase
VLDFLSPPHETVRARDATASRHFRTPRPNGAMASLTESILFPGTEPVLPHRAADERLLAALRLVAASVMLVSLLIDSGPFHHVFAQLLIAAYVVHATVVFLAMASRAEWVLRHVSLLHWIDFGLVAAATSMSGGTSSHIFPLFAFVLAAAAFRWGLARTLFDGALILAVASAQAVAASFNLTNWSFELDLFLMRSVYIGMVLALLFGVLAERMHASGWHAMTIARLVSAVSRAPGLSAALAATLVSLVRLVGARQILLAVEEAHTGEVSLWRARAETGSQVVASPTQLSLETRGHWRLPRAAAVPPCELHRRGPAGPIFLALSLDPRTVPAVSRPGLPPGVLEAPWTTLLVVPFSAGNVWSGQLYVLDPSRRPRGEIRLRFLFDITEQVTPGLLNLYLLRRLRSRAESLERGRISRELHDGVLQSLAGLEMRIEVLRRHGTDHAPALASELAEIQQVLREESMTLRELMQRLRPTEVDAWRLPGALADLVERFSRASGVEARLDWMVDGLDLPPHHCSEILRIVQEALFNVRRHSGATRALVRVEADACAWALIVEDNGRGLGFTGRLSHEQLDARGKGPRVIRERVSALGGMVEAESSSAGTRLEMTFPQQDRE